MHTCSKNHLTFEKESKTSKIICTIADKYQAVLHYCNLTAIYCLKRVYFYLPIAYAILQSLINSKLKHHILPINLILYLKGCVLLTKESLEFSTTYIDVTTQRLFLFVAYLLTSNEQACFYLFQTYIFNLSSLSLLHGVK